MYFLKNLMKIYLFQAFMHKGEVDDVKYERFESPFLPYRHLGELEKLPNLVVAKNQAKLLLWPELFLYIFSEKCSGHKWEI